MEPNIEEAAPSVFFVTASDTNFVLVVDGHTVTMVDSGYPKDRDLVVDAVSKIGRSLRDVHAVVLTHGHVDHKGCAEWLRSDHQIPAHCHAEEAPIARGEIKQQISTLELRRAWRPKIFRFAFHAIRNGGLRPEHLTEVATFADGDTLDIPGHPMVVHTPGHTQGHSSLHLPGRGVLITGDALITIDLWDHDRRGPQMIRPQFNHDHQQAIRSLDLLAGLTANVILPGHGELWRGSPAEAVEQVRKAL